MATVVAADALSPGVATANPRGRRPRQGRQTVAVFGGGIAGLTAAHELAERGFAVSVYESRAWGGRVRGRPLPGTARGGRQPLPAEHSFHAYFGTYLNLADTMRRIPFAAGSAGVFGNLATLPSAAFALAGKSDLVLPLGLAASQTYTLADVRDAIVLVGLQLKLPLDAVTLFADRMVVYLSSCDARRDGELERITWTDFIQGDSYGQDYRQLLGEFPQFLFASKPQGTSAKFMSWILAIFLVYNLLGFGNNGAVIRVLDGPVYDVWINPWIAELRRLGAIPLLGHELIGLQMHNGRIAGARVRTGRRVVRVTADFYVSALPVQRARALWTQPILAADPTLARMHNLNVANSNGIQYYLNAPSPVDDGIYQTLGMPWAPVFINQGRYWNRDMRMFGDGQVREILSAAIANWNQPGVLYGKPVAECTKDEYAREIWEQLKRVANKPGEPPRLTDDLLHSWHVDDAIFERNGHLHSEVPLVLPTAGTAQYRPDVVTAIPNLFLCGDYTAGVWEVGLMEAANFSGRRAVNALLASAGSHESPATMVGPYQPPEWEPLRKVDEQRYAAGQPNLFDLPEIPPIVSGLLGLGV